MADIMVRVDEKIKKEFQIYCINNNSSMQETLSKYISELMAKSESKQRRRA